MSANVHRTCGQCNRLADCTPVRQSPSLSDAKENREKKMATWNPGSETRAVSSPEVRAVIFLALKNGNIKTNFCILWMLHTDIHQGPSVEISWKQVHNNKCFFSRHTFLQQMKPAQSKTKIYYDSNPKTKDLSLENEATEVFIPNGWMWWNFF